MVRLRQFVSAVRLQASGSPPLLVRVKLATILPDEPKCIGIDVGTATFATLSDGEKVKNPRFFRKDANGLAKAQRRLEKVAKGTPKRIKCKQVVARIHERIANKRTDFAHKLSRQWVNRPLA